jgi:hypothetical protein
MSPRYFLLAVAILGASSPFLQIEGYVWLNVDAAVLLVRIGD